jgi:hypothetical protein
MADPPGTQHTSFTDTTTSEETEMPTKLQIPHQEDHLYSKVTSLEDELDFRLRQLKELEGEDNVRRDSMSGGGEFDALEDKDNVFGEDYGWECGIWCVVSFEYFFSHRLIDLGTS